MWALEKSGMWNEQTKASYKPSLWLESKEAKAAAREDVTETFKANAAKVFGEVEA
jgi:hypothetical protein